MNERGVTDQPKGLRFFATAYDPLDLASDSIDPLGFLKAYLALADRMLPGFTTVTSVPRYVPMLCAGVHLAERLHPRNDESEQAKERGRRLEVLRNYEKLWAIACGLARETGDEGAVAGLRGYRRYVSPFLQTHAGRADLSVGELNLTSNQVRYGGIGAYGQMLEACHFVDWPTLTLRPLGLELADAFPIPPSWSPERPNARLAKAALRSWGEEVGLEKMTSREATAMREGLSGGIEAERNDDVRWQSLRLLKGAGAADGVTEIECLRRFRGLVEKEPLGNARKAPAVRQLRAVAPLIEPLEQFYQALLFLFDEMRVLATENPGGCAIATLGSSRKACEAHVAAQRSEAELRKNLALAEKEDVAVAGSIAQAMRDSGITALGGHVASADSVSSTAHVLLHRHAAVQSGKFDRGQQKASWLRLDGDTARLTSQRKELRRGEHAQSWRDIARHPYRTAAAGNFVRQCRIG